MNNKLERRVAKLEKLVKEMFYADEYICDDCKNNPSEFFSTTIDVSQDGEDIPLSICSKCVDDDIAGYYAEDPIDSYDDFYRWVDINGKPVKLEK